MSQNQIDQSPFVTIGVTHATLGKNIFQNAQFWWHSFRIVARLSENEGFLGFVGKTSVLKGEAWTMTVWKDEACLDGFVRSAIHRKAIQSGYAAVLSNKFILATLPQEALPKTSSELVTFVAQHRSGTASDPVRYRNVLS